MLQPTAGCKILFETILYQETPFKFNYCSQKADALEEIIFFANKGRELFWIKKLLYLILNSLFIWKITEVQIEKGIKTEIKRLNFWNKYLRIKHLDCSEMIFVTRISFG